MSVINKMLQDLDRRQALGGVAETTPVRASVAQSGGREWFWRVVAVLLTAALAWMGWVAIQILPRQPLATDLAFQAAAEAQSRAAAKPAAPEPAAPAPLVSPAPAPVAEEAKPGDTLRLALQLETPVKQPEPVRAEPAKPEPVKAEPVKPKAAAAPKAAAKTSVDKRDRTRSAADNAETHFRRAALLLNHGRVSEAEDQLVAALQADPAHTAARQAYVALLLEQQRTDAARRLLQEALVINPEHATFALALSRIHAEQRDYAAALEVMERAGSVARNADFQALRGAVLQRLARHGEAIEAYQNAIRGGAQPASTWVGYGISLEAAGRRAEAAQAYRRALAAGPIAPEAREYAESRARALE
ncbi:MAG: tetratricopeptide repeat protein [Burkholderiales bacterium]